MILSKRLFLVAITLAAMSLMTVAAPAQERSARSDSPGGGGAQAGEGAQPTPTVKELNFAGGPIREYVRVVRSVFPNANIIVSDDAATFHVPSVQLRNVRLSEAVQLLEQVARDVEEPKDLWLPPRRLSTGLIGQSVWTVRAIAPQRPVVAQQPRRVPQPDPGPQTTVFSLADVLLEFSEADVLTSVETALGLAADEPHAELRLHEATGLLIVRGSIEQLNVVQAVVNQLRRAFEDRRRWKQAEATEEAQKLRALVQDLERSLLHEQERREEMSRTINAQRGQITELERVMGSIAGQRQPE